MNSEKAPAIVPHESLNSAVTESSYVPQETPRSCGIASILMARNLLLGVTCYPRTVTETLEIMQKKGYKKEKLGSTCSRDRKILIDQLNEYQDVLMVHKVLDMPSESSEYFRQLEQVLNDGGIVLLGFKKPYFDLPKGMEVETSSKSSHGVVVHGFKKGQDGEIIFIVTDPEPKITGYFGMNIEVSFEKLWESLSARSKTEIEVVSLAS
ncbi:hypothetical protein KA062_01090 [Patescibacteria group bacterium]|nr:hypothetical protein [Patescibacteria group bacterium]